jgi:hypothetical protein
VPDITKQAVRAASADVLKNIIVRQGFFFFLVFTLWNRPYAIILLHEKRAAGMYEKYFREPFFKTVY